MKVLFVLFLSLVVGTTIVSWNNSPAAQSEILIPNDFKADDKLPVVVVPTTTSTRKVVHLSLKSEQVVMLVGPIEESALDVANQIIQASEKQKSIYVLINSPGGSVIDGAQIVQAIQTAKVPVYTVCLSLCASMAQIIHSYGTKRYMVDRAILMAHPASGSVRGTLEEMQSRLTFISRYVDKFTAYVGHRAGLDFATYKQMITSEYWIDAEDATLLKFNDNIVTVSMSDSSIPSFSSTSKVGENSKRLNIRIE